MLLSSAAQRRGRVRVGGGEERREERRTGMKAECINSPPILLPCCNRHSNMQAHFLCQRLDGGRAGEGLSESFLCFTAL